MKKQSVNPAAIQTMMNRNTRRFGNLWSSQYQNGVASPRQDHHFPHQHRGGAFPFVEDQGGEVRDVHEHQLVRKLHQHDHDAETQDLPVPETPPGPLGRKAAVFSRGALRGSSRMPNRVSSPATRPRTPNARAMGSGPMLSKSGPDSPPPTSAPTRPTPTPTAAILTRVAIVGAHFRKVREPGDEHAGVSAVEKKQGRSQVRGVGDAHALHGRGEDHDERDEQDRVGDKDIGLAAAPAGVGVVAEIPHQGIGHGVPIIRPPAMITPRVVRDMKAVRPEPAGGV